MSLEIKDEVQAPSTEEGSSTETTVINDIDTTGNETQQSTEAEVTTNAQPQGEPEPKPEDTKEPEDTKDNKEFDYSKYEQEFLSTGDISEDSKAELYKVFPKNLVDNYIANLQQATAYAVAESEKKAFDVVGGEDNYKSLISWASANLDKDEKEAFNEAVSGSNEKLALQAIKGLKARMDLANTTSKKPNIVLGTTDVASTSGDVFLSRQDYANAIAKPEYQTSPQYRADVDAKLTRTLKSGGYKA